MWPRVPQPLPRLPMRSRVRDQGVPVLRHRARVRPRPVRLPGEQLRDDQVCGVHARGGGARRRAAAPTRRPPALAEFTLPRDRVRPRERPVTASEIIQHRAATNQYKDDLRAVKALNKFKVPKSRTSIVAI